MRDIDNAELAKSAIADTVQAVPYYFLERFANNPNIGAEALDQILAKETRGECLRASTHSLYMLSRKYPGLFDRLVLLRSVKDPNDPSTGFKDVGFEAHAYLLAHFEGHIEAWYAASPANFRQGRFNPLTTIFHSPRLKNVLRSIQERDGGTWPRDSEVINLLTNDYEPPVLLGEGQIQVTEILLENGKARRRAKTVTLSSHYPIRQPI